MSEYFDMHDMCVCKVYVRFHVHNYVPSMNLYAWCGL